MKAVVLYFSVLVTSFLASCSLFTDEGDYIERESSVVAQTVTTKTSSSVSFIARSSWGSSCGSFSRSVVTKANSIYSIKVFGKQPKNAICLTVMITFDAPVTVNIPSPGTYNFKFWQSDSTSIDTTLIIL